MTAFEFIEVNAEKVELGWRYDRLLPAEAMEVMSEFWPAEEDLAMFFSPQRTVSLAPFKIATRAVPWEKLFDCDEILGCSSYREACQLIEAKLAKHGWRLPTEDEFEAAAGGELFAWGKEIPEGIPYGKRTSFSKHQVPTANGLFLNDNPYQVELVSTVFKMGDGGVSICGGYAWPIAWLTLAPSYRVPEEMIDGCWPEYLEEALVRPVLL